MLNTVLIVPFVVILIGSSQGSNIPFLVNVSLIPSYSHNTTFSYNQTTQSCLCLASTSYIAFNWFPNGTCQFFTTFPLTYTMRPGNGARVYFPQRIFPNNSRCSMPNLTALLEKLQNGVQTSVKVNDTRNLIMNERGHLLAMQTAPPKLFRFNAENLSLINAIDLGGSIAYYVAYQNGTLFILFVQGPVVALDEQTMTQLGNSTSPHILNTREIIFMDQGNTMAISSFNNRSIIFLKRNSSSLYQYTFDYRIVASYSNVRGLTYVNDDHFYATDYGASKVYSYRRKTNSSTWNETLFIDASSIYNGTAISVTIDPDGRLWFMLGGPIILIYDQNGTFLDSFYIPSEKFFHALFTENFVLYLSDNAPLQKRILRINPNIDC